LRRRWHGVKNAHVVVSLILSSSGPFLRELLDRAFARC
jgi:hypothetical protein